MSHQIESNDIVLSDRRPEWHGLARVTPIDGETIKPLLFPIIELPTIEGVAPDGTPVKLEGFKALAADLRNRGGGFQPLHIHTESYKVIENGAVWAALEKALRNHPHTVTTAGTLGNCRRFFVSVALDQSAGFKVGSDNFLAYLNFVTSHDGSLALQAYDSNTRIVCQNTLNWSLQDQGAFRLHVKHTSGADAEIGELSRLVDATLASRQQLASHLERLGNIEVGHDRATRIIAGWKYIQQDQPAAFGTPTKNTVRRILEKFHFGRGCYGRSAYDLWNGVTEHYTSGAGAGLTTTRAQRLSSSFFGGAAAQKVDFTQRIIAPGGIEELEAAGREAAALLA
jgi:hypothetical protein